MSEIKKAAPHISQNEGLIFETSSPGKSAYRLAELDVASVNPADVLGGAMREDLGNMPEVSEIEIIRHFTRLSTWNYGVDTGLYPLGSCTMKYNARVNEHVARLEGIANAHPYQPEKLSQGALKILKLLSDALLDITGMEAITLQPAAGAHGEMTGILLVGKTRPGDFGVDVMHLNLHKTFSTPHGGGGPGSGPVACKKILEPFLPVPVVVTKADGSLGFDYERPRAIGRVRAFYGNFGMHVRALAYIMANGPEGLRQTTEDAVLNANYIRKNLEGSYELPYKTPTMHEVVFSDRAQTRRGVKTGDIAKRLIDYGFHPYTVSFPLIVPGALMIEPTESESKQELDLFIDAMKAIAEEAEQDPNIILEAPHTTRLSRLDEVTAARKPVLRWKSPTKAAAE